MADPNRSAGAAKGMAGAEHNHGRYGDDAHAVDMPTQTTMKKESLGERFENSPRETEAYPTTPDAQLRCGSFGVHKLPYVSLLRKVGAEVISTYILVFAGCAAIMVNTKSDGAVTHVGISLSFGIVVMIMVYSVGHISGAHMNPAVTLAFATVRHFPWKDVPLYVGGQVVAGICAAFSLRLIFDDVGNVGATLPSGTNGQSFILEIIATFFLMFVVSAVATDTRAVGELAGIAIGSTVALDALFAGPISGASMNPARSIGPAVAANNFRGIWVYMVGPVLGALFGAWGYNLIRGTAPTLMELEAMKTAKSFRR